MPRPPRRVAVEVGGASRGAASTSCPRSRARRSAALECRSTSIVAVFPVSAEGKQGEMPNEPSVDGKRAGAEGGGGTSTTTSSSSIENMAVPPTVAAPGDGSRC
jgi:hypothetical protein